MSWGDDVNRKYEFFEVPPNKNWPIEDKISHLQRRVIIHSILYYLMDSSIMSDQDFDQMAKYLVKLMKEASGEQLEKTTYWYAMNTFDASTGFYIYSNLTPEDQHKLSDLACLALAIHKEHSKEENQYA